MSIRDLDTIDLILERPPFETEECKLLLMIVDATSDLSDGERLGLLMKKLAGYFGYVAGPEFSKKYPGLKASDVIVRVLTVMPPTIDMQMVNALKTKEPGMRLRVFFDDYHSYMAKVKGMRRPAPGMN